MTITESTSTISGSTGSSTSSGSTRPARTRASARAASTGGSARTTARTNRAHAVPRQRENADEAPATPVTGLLDVRGGSAFLRVSGYKPGSDDVLVGQRDIDRYGLRRGDVVAGAARAERGKNRLARVDTVNGLAPEDARARPEFARLTALYPNRPLRLETGPGDLAGRIIDLVAPIGKGQRGLIVAPPKAGKTMVLQAIAAAVAANHPDAHLMVLLVDERPEEVTEISRAVRGEVIHSTFDHRPEEHTAVAELAIERAKRLVEQGHDVVVLLDSLTRLARAYNNSTKGNGRIMSGGLDSTALHPPKALLGAARNTEEAGSLTILATALVETGSRMDEVIFEELKGTGNMELLLNRALADKRVFPAVDVTASGTRREELLLTQEELSIVWGLRRALSPLDPQQAMERLLAGMKETGSNAEFLLKARAGL
ncbi:transcription termination factor Rho [Bailinhaonella thermotolerans]|uniref:Transcription termination factor Rho n=1 Tax=Bailinhaonella thermotolerans TaxID=1070861 RepID=A0A3A4A483_9ACTN|nr:transcription termination factor Rho [Bailinhaonella thermotolerans]